MVSETLQKRRALLVGPQSSQPQGPLARTVQGSVSLSPRSKKTLARACCFYCQWSWLAPRVMRPPPNAMQSADNHCTMWTPSLCDYAPSLLFSNGALDTQDKQNSSCASNGSIISHGGLSPRPPFSRPMNKSRSSAHAICHHQRL